METLLMKDPIKLSNNLNNKKTNSDNIKLSKGQYSIMIKIIFLLSLVVLFVVIKIVISNVIRLSSLQKENEEIIQKIKDTAIKINIYWLFYKINTKYIQKEVIYIIQC